ncbi:MAG: M1 family metallopeptidase, partial [Chitinophagaceae bacterium]|nr:M1 family metallopeptidase [Chitinophagaceae bacterium]
MIRYYLLKIMLPLAAALVWIVLPAQVPDIKTMNQAQRLSYLMKIDFNASANTFSGYQQVKYENNSADTLRNIFYHLFYNAFQRGSAMEERAMFIRDQEGYGQKMQALKPSEYGYHIIDSLKINGISQSYSVTGTILKIDLLQSIDPHASVIIELWFKSQVPKMIMRTGRNNPEGVQFTMTQWYPKIAAYDRAGWHANEYIRREFYGPFADFDVSIKMDSAYTIAATGILQNADQVGHGYYSGKVLSNNRDKKLLWQFKANTVHDFAWAADTAYVHLTNKISDSLQFHFFYKPATASVEDWKEIPEQVADIFSWMEKMVGPYPYPRYSLVQGGSGGTEYPMLSMILGHRPVTKGMSKGYSVLTLAIHEIMHNWWYAAVANDENRNAWLDEGFALFFQYEYSDAMKKNDNSAMRAIQASYDQILPPAKMNALEPMSTPSEYFGANWSYDVSAYHKGAIFLNQLKYIIGEEMFWKGIKKYYSKWMFGHPDGDDFINCMEQASGIQLKWYLDLW